MATSSPVNQAVDIQTTSVTTRSLPDKTLETDMETKTTTRTKRSRQKGLKPVPKDKASDLMSLDGSSYYNAMSVDGSSYYRRPKYADTQDALGITTVRGPSRKRKAATGLFKVKGSRKRTTPFRASRKSRRK